MPRPKSKTSTTLKMTPGVRVLWERRAAEEHRTLTNMFEVMVCTYAKKLRIPTEGSSNSGAMDE